MYTICSFLTVETVFLQIKIYLKVYFLAFWSSVKSVWFSSEGEFSFGLSNYHS